VLLTGENKHAVDLGLCENSGMTVLNQIHDALRPDDGNKTVGTQHYYIIGHVSFTQTVISNDLHFG
jgi:hypothetical protein